MVDRNRLYWRAWPRTPLSTAARARTGPWCPVSTRRPLIRPGSTTTGWPGKTTSPPTAEPPRRRPAAVLLLAILHFIPDSDDPAGIVATLTSALAPGSYLVISHLTGDLAPGPVAAGVGAYNDMVPTGVTPRTHAQVTALFGGLPLVP